MPYRHLACASIILLTACQGGRDATSPAPDFPQANPPGEALACAPVVSQSANPLAATDLLPVLSFPIQRGRLEICDVAIRTPSSKQVDGQIEDWIGQPSGVSGTSRLDAGELIHNDFLFDAYGADDGTDQQRLDLIDPLAGIDQRLARFDALMQAAGDQLGVPSPVGALDRYGNSVGLDAEADLYELRWAADEEFVYLLARWTTLTLADNAQLLVLIDNAEGGGGELGFDTGLSSNRFEHAVLLSARDVRLRLLVDGSESALADARVAVNAEGWTNAMEARLPRTLFGPDSRVSVLSLASTENGLVPANVVYRDNEPVTIYNERQQALALAAGNIDGFGHALDIGALTRGDSQTIALSSGYHERQMVSGDNISREDGENGRLQPYGLYLPSEYSSLRAEPVPLDIWLHYRGGKAHSGAAWTPRLIEQLGETHQHVVVTPRGRGTSTWYVTQAHQDVFEVLDDVHALLPNLDRSRQYLSGYSMGGYGTYLFGLLYPDQFAAGYSTSGAVTQGAWTGLGPDDFTCTLPGGTIPGVGDAENPCFIEANDGRANAQLKFRLLDNALHFPLVIHHGTNDELALTPGAVRMGQQLLTLGYRHEMTLFAGYEHFTQAIIDEWADGVAYLHRFSTPANPRRIVYKQLPAMIDALNTVRSDDIAFDFQPDGAWWVDDLRVRDADPQDPAQFGMVDVSSLALPAPMTVPLPTSVEVRPDEPALSTPVLSIGAHSTPYIRTGLDQLTVGEEPLANGFTATVTQLASLSLDVARMGLDAAQPMSALVQSDGETMLRLHQLPVGITLQLNGETVPINGAEALLQLSAGESQISW